MQHPDPGRPGAGPGEVTSLGRPPRRSSALPIVGMAVVLALVGVFGSPVSAIALWFLALKLVLSRRRARLRLDEAAQEVPLLDVAVVIPMYNEDPAAARETIGSLIEQTRPPQRIHVVDDGSTSPEALHAVEEVAAGSPVTICVHRHDVNRGKREAMATAVSSDLEADIFITVDSDTVLEPDAVDALLRPFADKSVVGATGMVRVLNRRRNTLTRLLDVRYANAFLLDRGFQSFLGSVLCACGSLAAWRRPVVIDNLEDFINQRFLGRRCTYGDDRRLTNYALQTGRVVLVPEAVAHTLAPERLGHYARQQTRWNRSFLRESLWAVMRLPLSRPAAWLSLFELSSWIFASALMVFLLVIRPAVGMTMSLGAVGVYVAYASLIAWLRSMRWIDAGVAGESRKERALTFLIAPLYALLHLFVLLPVRFYALFTLRRTGWGTRSQVEVALAGDAGVIELEPVQAAVFAGGGEELQPILWVVPEEIEELPTISWRAPDDGSVVVVRPMVARADGADEADRRTPSYAMTA